MKHVDFNSAHPRFRMARQTFFKKTIDPKIETAINTAPQVRGPFQNGIRESDGEAKKFAKTVDDDEDLNRMSLPLNQRVR